MFTTFAVSGETSVRFIISEETVLAVTSFSDVTETVPAILFKEDRSRADLKDLDADDGIIDVEGG